jgi:hypothetical protein
MKFRPEQFSPCRVACLTINDHVVTALTYRVTKPTTCGAAVMVRSCMFLPLHSVGETRRSSGTPACVGCVETCSPIIELA